MRAREPRELKATAQRKAFPPRAELSGGRPLAVAASRVGVHGREPDRERGRERADHESAEQGVAAAAREKEPGRAGAEEPNRQNAARDVVGAEERRAPSEPLAGGLADRRDGEAGEAGRPEGLLSRGPLEERPSEQQHEEQRDESCGDRQQRVGDLRRGIVVRAR